MPKLKSYERQKENKLVGARGLVRYYQSRISETDNEPWQTGLRLATEFLRLLEADVQNPQEFDDLLQIANDFQENGSGAYDLYLHVSGWQRFLQSAEQVQSDNG